MNLTKEDKAKLVAYNISEETVKQQVLKLINGPKDLNLKGACVVGNGITRIDESKLALRSVKFDELKGNFSISMFTPASGAATRMFKHLLNPKSNLSLYNEFTDNLERFAFDSEIKANSIESIEGKVEFILSKQGLNYAKLPKAMISFHQYEKEVRKAIDDQLIEGLSYLKNDNKIMFHFTVSPEHKEVIESHLVEVINKLEKKNNVEIQVEFSFQEKHTDTVAVDENGELVRDESNQILLRPGGHGALIHNLNQIQSDVIFIKNIDNIAREEHHENVANYKKVIGAELMEFQDEIFNALKEIENSVTPERLEEISDWLKERIGLNVNPEKETIYNAINRPIRVCGMVKNEGKAGGGPFWVGNSVQIVESAQMNLSNPKVTEMLKEASHFNPVDIVCGVKNYKGEKFDLLQFTDDSTFFVSDKSYLGKDIKVLEHPGLWNGAMAKWLTLFVEVPVSTFNPVKTVNDLLLPQHCVK